MTTPGNVIATAFVKVLADTREFSRNLRHSVRASSRELRAIDREIRPVQQALRGLALTATGIVPGIQLATAGFAVLGGHAIVGGILALGGALLTASGALLTIPAAGVAAVSVMGALSVGLRGIGDALKHFDDVEKFNEDLDKLSGNAHDAIGVFGEMRGEINDFRNSVQDRLFAGLDDQFRDLGETFLPRLTDHFGKLSDVINLGVKDLSNFVQTGATLQDIDEVTGNTEEAFGGLRAALIPAATAFRDIITVGSRFLPMIVNNVVELVTRFSDWISIMRATGQLETSIGRGITAFKQLFLILGNVARAIHAVFQGAQLAGVGFLDTLENLTDKLADFLSSTRGQNMIKNFMISAREAAEALLPSVLAIVDVFFVHLVPILEKFAITLGPAVAKFITGIGDALDEAGPGVDAFAQGFATFIMAIVPILPLIGQLVGALGELVGVLAAGLGPAVADVATAIGSILIPIIQALTAVFSFLSPEVIKFIVVIGTVIAAVAGLIGVIRGVQALIVLFAGAFELLNGATVKTGKGLKGFVSFLGGPWGIAIGIATIALGLFLSESDNTSAAVQSLSAALEGSVDSTEKATRAWILQELEQKGVADSASQLGIGINTLIDAYRGLPDAQQRVTQAFLEGVESGKISFDQYEDMFNLLRDGPGVINKAAEAQERKNAADREGGNVGTFLSDVLKVQKGVLDEIYNAQVRNQNQQLASLNAELGYQSQLARTTEELKEGALTLDLHNQEGRDNLQVLSELATAGVRRVEQLKSEKATTDVVNAAIAQNREAILSLLDPFFQTREAARLYAEKIGLIPKAPTTTPVFNDAPARAKASAFSIYLDNLVRPRTVKVDVDMQNIPGLIGEAVPRNARGGSVPGGSWSWVGEDGPELVRFGRAARVFSNGESMRMSRDVGALDLMTTRGGNGTSSYPTKSSQPVQLTNQVDVQPTVKVYIDGHEFRGMVRVEMDARDRKMTRLINTGSGRRQ